MVTEQTKTKKKPEEALQEAKKENSEEKERKDQPEKAKETEEKTVSPKGKEDGGKKDVETAQSKEEAPVKKADPREQLIQELKEKYTRQIAEFDNFRKRTEKEKTAMYEIGARDVLEKILPVVDNFERGLSSAKGEGSGFVEGMQMIYKQLMAVLEEIGVKPIEATGKEFDPNFHNAVAHVEDEAVGENLIVEELQKGYTYRETVIRHSMVKVAN